jgi:hypothetical protein
VKFGLWHKDGFWLHNTPVQPLRCSLLWAEKFLQIFEAEGRENEFEIKRWIDGWNFVDRAIT